MTEPEIALILEFLDRTEQHVVDLRSSVKDDHQISARTSLARAEGWLAAVRLALNRLAAP